jgi:hypothetical protein
VLKQYFTAAEGIFPSVLFTDRDVAMQAAISATLPTTHHLWCIWHVLRSIMKNIQGSVTSWAEFSAVFWECQRASSSRQFQTLWTNLLSSLPEQPKKYLTDYFATDVDKWANYARLSLPTRGMQSTQGVESMNAKVKGVVSKYSDAVDLAHQLTKIVSRQQATKQREDMKTTIDHDPIEDDGMINLLRELAVNCSPFCASQAKTEFLIAFMRYNASKVEGRDGDGMLEPAQVNHVHVKPADFGSAENSEDENDEEAACDSSESLNALEKEIQKQVKFYEDQVDVDSVPFPSRQLANWQLFKVESTRINVLSSRYVAFDDQTKQWFCQCGVIAQHGRLCRHIFRVWLLTNASTSISLRHFSPVWRKLHNFDRHSFGEAKHYYTQRANPELFSPTIANVFYQDDFGNEVDFKDEKQSNATEKTHVQRMLALLSRMYGVRCYIFFTVYYPSPFRLALQAQEAAQDIQDLRAINSAHALDVALIYLKVGELQRSLIKRAKQNLNNPALQFSNQRARDDALKAGYAASFQTKRRKQFTNRINLPGSPEEAVCSLNFIIGCFSM